MSGGSGGVLLARAGGGFRAWCGVTLSSAEELPVETGGADEATARRRFDEDVAFAVRQLVPAYGLVVESRVLAEGGRVRTLLLGRVDGPDEPTALAAAGAARGRLLALPNAVEGEPIPDPAELQAALAPFRPDVDGLASVRKYVIGSGGPSPHGVAVQPLNAGPWSWAAMLTALARHGPPVLLSVGLAPTQLPSDYPARLQRLADSYLRLATPRFAPAGLYSGRRTVPADPFAVDAEALYRDAARRYRDVAFRFRISVASPQPLDDGLLELVARTISPPAGPADDGPGVPRPDHGTYEIVRPGYEAAAVTATVSTLEVPASRGPVMRTSAGDLPVPVDLLDAAEAVAAFRPSAAAEAGVPGGSPAPGFRLFVSYRSREWSSATMLRQALEQRFPAGAVFFDTESLHGGERVQARIMESLAGCAVLLAVIDRDWLTIPDASGRRRLDSYGDWVRTEIRYALWHGLEVIPVLVGDAMLPPAHALPADLAGLADREALRIRHVSAAADLARLVDDVGLALRRAWRARRAGGGPGS